MQDVLSGGTHNACRSSGMAEELAKKTAEQKDQLANHGTEFLKVFREEVGKLLGLPGRLPARLCVLRLGLATVAGPW